MATSLRVEIVEKLITARVERADENGNFLAGGHDLFAMKLGALELGWGRVVVVHDESDLDAGRDLHLARNELVVFQHNRKSGIIRQGGGRNSEDERCRKPGKRNCEPSHHPGVGKRMRIIRINTRLLRSVQAKSRCATRG